MIYYRFVKDIKPYKNEDDDEISVAEQIARFDAQIGQAKDPEIEAREKMRAMLIALGKDPDAAPDLSDKPELAAKLENDALRNEEELYFSGDLHSGRELRGRKIKATLQDVEYD